MELIFFHIINAVFFFFCCCCFSLLCFHQAGSERHEKKEAR